MEIKFNSKLDYQKDAINSVINLFKGQSKSKQEYSVSTPLSSVECVGNRFEIGPSEIEENFFNVQESNHLIKNSKLNSRDFTIEMETGTGKTYVFLRTILELNLNYGFTKFVIVVPSVAIREGINKTLEITKKHFSELYDNINYNSFVFNSDNLNDLRDFAMEDNIQIMIITVQSFQSDKNKINKVMENGIVPSYYISSTNPIVIIDEPQSTSGTNDRKEAIRDVLNPLFTLQYSATPKDADNLIYKLDAIDAYNLNLVKRIEVDAFDSADYSGKPFLYLNTVKNLKSGRKANITLVKNTDVGLDKKTVNVKVDDDLSVKKISNNSVYSDYKVKDISVREDDEYVEFYNGEILHLNQSINDINHDEVAKSQIESTIREHLKKELKLKEKNIKVLSLFFIDSVKNYRFYDENGANKGKYAVWFEKLYNKIIQEEEFKTLPKHLLDIPVEETHDGYFSVDNKKWADTSGRTKKDDDTYKRIMKDKEKLLNPNDDLRFIFSHSTLKEGWDNPNVFQICTLIETQSDLSKRQKIGRGLRLCVDGDGNRVDASYGEDFKDINRLTVLANESFDNFAKSLQNEMEKDGIKFGGLKIEDLIDLEYTNLEGESVKTTAFDGEKIFKNLIKNKYITKEGKTTKKWEEAVNNDNVNLPEKYENLDIIPVIENISNVKIINNKNKRETVKLDEEKIESDTFNDLWDKIKHKTMYKVTLNKDELIKSCIKDMRKDLGKIERNKIHHTKNEVEIKDKIEGITISQESQYVTAINDEIPNIVKDLHERTHLTKQTIIDILIESNKQDNTFEKLLLNPTEYYNITLEIIQSNLETNLVEDIEYYKTGESYNKSDFKKEYIIYLDDDKVVKNSKSIYEYIKCDSKVIEKDFAKQLDNREEVKLFVKLPDWFKIKTPLSSYNPDWAIVLNVNGVEKTYFVIETKGTTNTKKRRASENEKIKCGEKHFEALGEDITFDDVDTVDKFLRTYAIKK